MNFDKIILLISLSLSSYAGNNMQIPWQGPIPWRANNRYTTKSEYELHLDGIRLAIIGKKDDLKKSGFYRNDAPFSGYHRSVISYDTTECIVTNNGKQGSVYRFYQEPVTEFKAADNHARAMILKYRPDWIHSAINSDPSTFTGKTKTLWAKALDKSWYGWGSTVQGISVDELELGLKDARFFFREAIEGFDPSNVYLLSWDSLSALTTDNIADRLIVTAKSRNWWDNPANTNDASRRMAMRKNGDEPPEKVNVAISAEAKLLAHTLFDQGKIRRPGECWYITPKKLESFLPVTEDDKRQPFSFSGNYLVLNASINPSNSSLLVVTVVESGAINGTTVSTDLLIKPNTKAAQQPTFTRPQLTDSSKNKIHFSVNADYEIIESVDIELHLDNYCGGIPEATHFKLSGNVDSNFEVVGNLEGSVVLKVKTITTVIHIENNNAN